MSLVSALIEEFQAEAAITRRVLERVPDDRLTWKPHPKSMTAGELALHVAFEPGALVETARRGGVDFGAHQSSAAPRSVNHILAVHDASVERVVTVLTELGESGLQRTWTATINGTPIRTLSNAGFVRTVVMNHTYHHRGQLSVYLRLLDVAVPPIYGPSADENPFAQSGRVNDQRAADNAEVTR